MKEISNAPSPGRGEPLSDREEAIFNGALQLRPEQRAEYLKQACSEDAELLVRMEKLFGVKLAFRADLNYHVENFKIINALTGEEYR